MAGQEVQGMLIRLEATTAQMRQELARADSSVTQVSGRIDRQLAQVDSAFDRVGISAQRVAGVLKNALAIGIGGAGIGALVSQAEAYTQIANRLKLVTSSSAEFTAAQNAVFSIAQRSGQPLTATAELYQRIAQNQEALKLNGKGVAGIVETISKTMVVSGTSAASAEAALVQLGQAFASGTLRGEELNSVMEQAPALSQAIAKGMGVSVGALRALGAEGKLTAESVVQALQAQQGAVDALFGKMQDTIGTGLTRVQTSFTKMIGEGDKVGGMSSRISAALTSASRAMDAVTADGEGFAETVKNVGNALENVAYVGAAALALGAGKLVVSFANAADAAIKQAVSLGISTKASLEALTADAALARQSVTTAQTRQLGAKALLERANLEVVAAEGKVAADRVRQASELGNLKLVQSSLAAERELEGQRLKAQITDQGRALSIARIVELRTAEVGSIKLIEAAEVSLAATTVATSAEIQAAHGVRTAAAAGYAETKLATNEAIAVSERATAAAGAGARASLAMTAAGGGLLALLSGPVGLIAMTALVAASFIDFGDSADKATAALIDQNLTVDESIAKFKELRLEQQRLMVSDWTKEQIKATESAAQSLENYTNNGILALNSLGLSGINSVESFKTMIGEVRAGTRSLDSVTAWVTQNNQLLPAFKDNLEKVAGNYVASSDRAKKFGDQLSQVNTLTASATSETGKLTVAQKSSGQTDASKAAWDKYVEQLTKTRDLLGANAVAEAAYTAAKMGATPAQAAQAKLIADQTDTLKKYQDAIKEGDKVQQASLKLQLVALYAAEDAATQATVTQSKAYADTATAAENSARRQITAIEQAANFAVTSATRVALGAAAPQTTLSGYGLLTNGGSAPVVPPAPKATPLERATASIAQLDATTEANKRVDKAANAAATALKNQEKALTDLLAKSGISTKASNDIADAYLTGATNVRELTIRQEIEQEVLKTGAKSYDQVKDAVNALHDAKDREDVMKNVAELKVEVEQILKQATATLQGKEALEAYNVEKALSIALTGKKIAVGSEEYKQLKAVTEEQLKNNKALESAGRIEGIIDRLNPEIKLLKDYRQAQEDINSAMLLAPGNTALYQDALVKLGNEYEVNRSKATLWGQMTEGAIDRIDEAFATAWGNIGSGAESLWDNLKKGFKQTLGEIAHMLTTKPLLASFSNWLTGTDNGQGLSSVWGKLLGSAGGSSSGSGGGLFSGLAGIGKNLYSAWNAITGVGSSVASGYASGGVSGAISGGAGYYGNMISNISSTLSNGFSSLVSTITGTTAAQTAATIGAQGITSAVLSGAVTEGATAIGAQFTTGVATTTAATYAAAEAGAAATAASLGGQISAAMSSAAAMWPLAVVMGMYQSGKLYSSGVRPDAGEMWDSAGSTALGKAAMLPQTVGAKYFEVTDNILGKVVGGKMAAILSGSTLFQAVWSKVGSKLFGSGYETKDTGISLGVEGGALDAQQYVKQKKKGGVLSGSSKTRFLYNPLDEETSDVLGAKYNEVVLGAGGLFTALGIQLNESVLDGLNMASRNISTKDATPEWIQQQLDFFFAQLGDAAVIAISNATDAGLSGFSYVGLQAFVKNLQDVNGIIGHLNIGLYDMSVSGGFMAEQLSAWAGGIDALQASAAGYYDKFFTDAEKAANTLSDVRKEFENIGVALPDSRQGYRDMVEGIDRTTEAGRAMLLTLWNLSGDASLAFDILESRADAATEAAKTLANTLAETLNAAVTGAMGAVQRAVSADKEAATKAYNARVTSLNDMVSTATENVSGLTSVGNDLSAALKALRGDSDDAVKMLRAQAQATLQSALATARSGGSLSGITGLSDALDTVSNNNTDLYGSMEDFARDQGRTANVVAELNVINGKQLTTEEQLLASVKDQVKQAKDLFDEEMLRLDNQLAFAQSQLDALNGIDNSVISVTAALGGLSSAITAALAAKPAGSAAANTSANNSTLLDAVYQSVLGRDVDAAGAAYWGGLLQSGGIDYAGLVAQITKDATANGELKGYAIGGLINGPGTGTSDSIFARLSNGEYVMSADAVRMFGTGLLDQMNAGQLPAFAMGGGVGELGPQLEVTGPSRIFNANQAGAIRGGGDFDAILAELKQTRAENKEQRFQMAKANKQMVALLEKFDAEGLPQERDYAQ